MSTSQRVFLLLSLFGLLGVSYGLKCYVCVACDGVDDDDLEECTIDGSECWKTVVHAGGEDVTSRSCSPGCSSYDHRVAGIGAVQTCCDTDGCNTGAHVTAAVYVVAAASALALAVRHAGY